jgi:hypothetical protein
MLPYASLHSSFGPVSAAKKHFELCEGSVAKMVQTDRVNSKERELQPLMSDRPMRSW